MWYVTLRNGKILIVQANLFGELSNKLRDHNIVSVQCMYREDDDVWCLEKQKEMDND